jgi:LysR family transcriptional regulator, transcriptional activator of nhaA
LTVSALNYNHLRYFRAVAHEGSLTRAAERLNLSQSALSVQLQRLEAQLGHALFDRVGKRLVLTEAGRVALDHADTVFAAGDALINTLAGRPALDQQVLRVGALPTLSRNFQLGFVRPLVGRTDVELILRSGTMRELLALLEAHEVDVVLAGSPARSDARAALVSHRIASQAISLIGPPARRQRAFRFPESLADAPLLLPSRDSEVRQAFDRLLAGTGIRPTILAEVDDMAMLRLLARESDALTLVAPIVVQDELHAGTLVEIHRLPMITEDYFAITQERRFPNPLLAGLLATPPLAV